MNDVIFNKENIVKINDNMICELKDKALRSTLRKSRLCLHKDIENPLHEMIIVHCRGNYIRPHKHMNKTESFHIIEGSLLLTVFDNDGTIIERFNMDDKHNCGYFMFRIEKDYWHTMIPLTDFIVFHEVTNGPFTGRDDSVFPCWAPLENDKVGIRKFVGKILIDSKTVPCEPLQE